MTTNQAATIVESFYAAVLARDLATARTYLADDLVFVGLFETYRDADHYMTTFTGLLQITERIDIKVIVGDASNAAIFFDLVTKAPVPATTLVAEWHEVRDGKIVRAHSAFDGRPFAAMFAGAGR
jgi:ketosteroid isomerase-like protein